MPALPPPMSRTSYVSARMCLSCGQRSLTIRRSFGGDGGSDRFHDHGRHVELGVTIPDVVTPGDPGEVGPNRPDVAIVVLRQQQADGQSRPALGLDVINCVPSGGLPKM